MKSTKWISDKLKDVIEDIAILEEQIRRRNIKEDSYNTVMYYYPSGSESSLTINERLHTLVSKKMILTEILQ